MLAAIVISIGRAIVVPENVLGFVGPPATSTTGRLTQGSAVVVVLILLGVMWCYSVWRARLEYLAYAPGPITVRTFQDHTTSGADSGRAKELTAAFENYIVRTKIYGSTAIPSTGRPSDFFSVVESAGDKLAGAWGAASRLVRVLAPLAAYQVGCTMQKGTEDAPCVLLLELSRLPSTSIAPVVIRTDSWDDAVRQAALCVVSHVLPCTRRCDNAPWRLWRRSRLPAPLFSAYQEFLTYRAERKLDDAMTSLRRAIRLDPGNLAMRLDLGKLQERMQMYLDALLTYDDIITVAARRDRNLAAWWTGFPARSWADARRTRGLRPDDPVILIARYRHAMMLGLSERLAQQWWTRNERCSDGRHRSMREERRAYLRSALAERLSQRYPTLLGDGSDDTKPDQNCLEALSSVVNGRDRRIRIANARIFFATVSQLEFEYLARDYAPRRLRDLLSCLLRARRLPLRAAPHRRPLSQWIRRFVERVRWTRLPGTRGWRQRAEQRRILPREAILTGLPWSSMRRAMALAWARRAGVPTAVVSRAAFSVEASERGRSSLAFRGADQLIGNGWPPDIKYLQPVVERLTGRPGLGLKTWRAHFNAACTLALPLLPDGLEIPAGALPPERSARDKRSSSPERATTDNETAAARAAIIELERAVARADSGFVAQQRDWLLSEEPDLDHLRGHAEFRNFEATTFGSIGSSVGRGPDIHLWEQSAYVARFIHAAAMAMADLWQGRRHYSGRDPVSLSVWLDEELAGWRLAEQLAMDGRDSRTRQYVAQTIRRTGRLTRIKVSRSPTLISPIVSLISSWPAWMGWDRAASSPSTGRYQTAAKTTWASE